MERQRYSRSDSRRKNRNRYRSEKNLRAAVPQFYRARERTADGVVPLYFRSQRSRTAIGKYRSFVETRESRVSTDALSFLQYVHCVCRDVPPSFTKASDGETGKSLLTNGNTQKQAM